METRKSLNSTKINFRNVVAATLETERFSKDSSCEIPIAFQINYELYTNPEIITKNNQKFILLKEKETESLFP